MPHIWTNDGHHTDLSADRMKQALFDLYDDCDPDPLRLMAYALCDLRHLCDSFGTAFHDHDKAGHALYLEERKDRLE